MGTDFRMLLPSKEKPPGKPAVQGEGGGDQNLYASPML